MLINPYRYAAGAATDPHFANVSVLIETDTNSSGAAVDSSSNALPLTGPSGGAPRFISSGGPFSGAGGTYIDLANTIGGSSPGQAVVIKSSIVASSVLDCSAGDYTEEGWFFLRSGTSWEMWGMNNFSSKIVGITAGNLRWIVDNSNVTSSFATPINTWHHVALVMTSNAFVIYVDGIAAMSPVSVSRTSWVGQSLSVGASDSFGNLLPGAFTNYRLTKGVARYSSNFTPPTAPFPTS